MEMKPIMFPIFSLQHVNLSPDKSSSSSGFAESPSSNENYEIVDEARPLSGFYPHHADFSTEMHF